MEPGLDVTVTSDIAAAAPSVREEARRAFLAEAGYGDARREPLAGDASTRAYERLHLADGGRLILMDAPPVESAPCGPGATEAERRAAGYNALARLAASRVDAFAATALYLHSRGLSAPAIEALDCDAGFAVIEDLGDGLFARLIADGAATLPLYETAVDLLVELHAEAPPSTLAVGDAEHEWPLLDYDALALTTGADLFPEWAPRLSGVEVPAEALDEWRALWAPIAAMGGEGASVFTHRDYHAENLLWLAERSGLARVGLLDFQDAVRAHPAWDLASLLQDARRDVAEDLEQAMIARYLAARPHLDPDRFRTEYAALAALNASRILGIFARLVVRDRKPRYAGFIPRMRAMLARNLRDPGLAGLKAWFERYGGMG
jgi:aminoglycoside/choline kinase family phosphotransferase